MHEPIENRESVRRGQEHFFAELDRTDFALTDPVDQSTPSSLWRDAWRNLRRRTMFWIAAALIILVVLLAAFPGIFTQTDPRFCDLSRSLDSAQSGHPFGFDRQGCDIYSRIVYGARTSVTIAVLTTVMVLIVGGLIGAFAGFYGKWTDAVLSRAADIFFALPLVLGAIVLRQAWRSDTNVLVIVCVLAIFGWPQIARITRGAVMSVRESDFITAAKALGASRLSILFKHALPNALAPMIVTATTSLGTFIVAEATLSFLGVGLNASEVMSWGAEIAKAQTTLRTAPTVLFFPAGALALTVLGFIMMGDVVRDALDPKARK
jgi:oligopeptide transport system permease protein